jgi:hypothetical protein
MLQKEEARRRKEEKERKFRWFLKEILSEKNN